MLCSLVNLNRWGAGGMAFDKDYLRVQPAVVKRISVATALRMRSSRLRDSRQEDLPCSLGTVLSFWALNASAKVVLDLRQHRTFIKPTNRADRSVERHEQRVYGEDP